ncbi:MAG: DUF6515 family protein, partial [Pseudomonadota bacterium]
SSGGSSSDQPEAAPMVDDGQNYQVVNAPVGASVPYLPDDAVKTKIDGKTYFVHDDAYYQAFSNEDETIYVVVNNPNGDATATTAPAQSEEASSAVDQCVAGLSPNGKKVYDAVAGNIQPGDDAEDQFKSIVRNMVKNGELSRSDAKAAAQEASECLGA